MVLTEYMLCPDDNTFFNDILSHLCHDNGGEVRLCHDVLSHLCHDDGGEVCLRHDVVRENSIYSHLLLPTGVVTLLIHVRFSHNSCYIIG